MKRAVLLVLITVMFSFSPALSERVKHELILMKIDSLGDTLWSKTWATEDPFTQEIHATRDSGYLILYFDQNNCFKYYDEDTYSSYFFDELKILKTDSLGNVLWSRSFVTYIGGHVYEYGWNCVETDDGSFVFVGTVIAETDSAGEVITDSTGSPVLYRIFKLDSAGSPLWKSKNPGFWYNENRICRTSDGMFVIASVTPSIGTDEDGKVALKKLDTIGDSIWARVYKKKAIWGNFVIGLVQTSEQGFMLSGVDEINEDGTCWIMKTNRNGNPIRVRKFKDEWWGYWDHSCLLYNSADGEYFYSAPFKVLKLNRMGRVEWEFRYEHGFDDLAPAPDGGCILVARERTELAPSEERFTGIWLTRLNPQGVLVWERCLSPFNGAYYRIDSTPDGGYVILGTKFVFP